jgi:hypothetical protein
MNRKEVKAKVEKLLSEGHSETEVFDTLAKQDVDVKSLACVIASRFNPERGRANRGHLVCVRIIILVQALLAVPVGFGLGLRKVASFPRSQFSVAQESCWTIRVLALENLWGGCDSTAPKHGASP